MSVADLDIAQRTRCDLIAAPYLARPAGNHLTSATLMRWVVRWGDTVQTWTFAVFREYSQV